MTHITLGTLPTRGRDDALTVIGALDLENPALAETMRFLALEHGDDDLGRLLRTVRRLERTPLTSTEAAAFDRLIDWVTLGRAGFS
ncbi:MAG TPA: hypothetical protein VHN99_04615 [Deinococcales bacterium]|nr:hypothetical protein [Deinococcales bacterium]